ncbi:MAG: extracellular solute-binding protein [Treponema sp.]|jgi:multiple sugar transport system substrate-binding protein|nr:extracellular solute-binding protein [Treponema sp.]
MILKQPEHKKIFLVVLILAGLIIAGHGIVNGVKPAAPAKTTLILSLSGKDDGTEKALGAIVEEFEETRPEIRVVLSAAPDEKADVLVFDETEFGALVRDGLLASLDPYLPSETGKPRWAVPLVSFMDLLFYNIDLLADAGFDRPPKNRAEFLRYGAAAAKRAAEKRPAAAGPRPSAGPYGAALSLSGGDPLGVRRDVFSWIWASGASLVQEGRPLFAGGAAAEALDFLGELSRQGLLAPGAFTETGTRRIEEFEEGKIAMMIGSSAAIPRFRKTMREGSFGVSAVPVPAGGGTNAGKPVFSLHSRYAAVSGQCRYPGEAWTFLAFLAEKSAALAAELQAVPGGRDMNAAVNAAGVPSYIENDSLLSKAWDMYEAADIVREFEGLPAAEELEKAVREELVPLLGGRRNGTETAAAIQKRWDALLGAD